LLAKSLDQGFVVTLVNFGNDDFREVLGKTTVNLYHELEV
jgi:hypothetical protein